MFAVDDIDDIIDRLRPHGAELVGELVRYENSYRLCYLRGPAGIIVSQRTSASAAERSRSPDEHDQPLADTL
jgi:hypothetical protein